VALLTYATMLTKPGPKPKDLTGMVFGHLTAVRPTGKRTRQGVVWVVRCQCGKELERVASALLSKPRRPSQIPASCGCFGKRNRSPKYKGVGDLSSTKFRGIMAKAKQRGIPFGIPIEYAWKLFLAQDKRCSLTGILLTLSPSSVEVGASTASLDRIDSSKGYVPGNVQWVHVAINFMKHSLPLKEFVDWCCRVAAHTGMAYGKEFGKGTEKEPWLY